MTACGFIISCVLLYEMSASTALKVAIVGGGISGTSVAYFLSKLPQEDLQIDLYEGGNIGGRLATVTIDGIEYETGGSIIHHRNLYARNLAKTLGLDVINDSDLEKKMWALYDEDEKEFIFTESKYWILNNLKLCWRYGFNIFQMKHYIEDLLTKFDNVYSLQQDNKAFIGVRDLLDAIDPTFSVYMNISSYAGFKAYGFSDKFINEVIQASVKCNYGQTTSIHQFAGSVSIAADGNLFSIEGGNKLLPQKLLEASSARLIKQYVESISLINDGKFNLKTSEGNNEYDVVVVSTPLTLDTNLKNKIEFLGFPKRITVPGSYKRTVCTIVRGEINSKYYGLKPNDMVPDMIITITNSSLINSVSKIDSVTRNKMNGDVWKIFSSTVLSSEEINKLFDKITVVKVIDWQAYPHYLETWKYSYNFTLYDQLYYSNAIEWSASAIEMGIIAARNVVLLIQSMNEISAHQFQEKSTLTHDEM